MSISKETHSYINTQIDYYINEVESYKQIAKEYIPDIESIPDTTFGIIIGCVYSSFLQVFQSQQKSPSLEEIQEFNTILKKRSVQIKKAIIKNDNFVNQR